MGLRFDSLTRTLGKLGSLSSKSFALRVAGLVSTFGLGILLARSLGPTEYGIYGLVTTLAALAMTIAQLGTPQLAVRDLSVLSTRHEWSQVRRLVRTFTMATALMGLALGSLAVAATLAVFPSRFVLPAAQGSILMVFMALTSLSASQLRGLGAILKGQSMDNLGRPAVALALVAAFLIAGFRLTATVALWIQIVVAVASTIISYFWIARLMPRSTSVEDSPPMRWIGAALPLGAVDVLRQLDGAYGMILVGWLASGAELGVYRVAVACMVLSSMPVTIVHVIYAPDLARLYAEGKHQELQRLLTLTSRILTGVMLLITGGAWVLGKFALTLVFGAAYAGAWLPLFLLTCTQLIYALFGMGNILLAMCGGERHLIAIYASAVTVAILAAIPLTYAFGAAGTAAASMITATIICICSHRYARHRLGVEITGLPTRKPVPRE